MTGEVFRESLGGYDIYKDENTGEENYHFHNTDNLKIVRRNLRVLARATAEDKKLLIASITND